MKDFKTVFRLYNSISPYVLGAQNNFNSILYQKYRLNNLPHAAMTFEKIVAKEEIAGNDQLLLLPQCFQLNFIIFHSFTESFHNFS